MPPDVKSLLFDMPQAAIGIGLFVDGKTVDDLKSDLMLRLAIGRQFEIIGEAMSRLRKASPDTVARISEYRGILSFRNVLSQGYDAVNTDTTWQIIQNMLPVLCAELERLLNEP